MKSSVKLIRNLQKKLPNLSLEDIVNIAEVLEETTENQLCIPSSTTIGSTGIGSTGEPIKIWYSTESTSY